MRTLITEVLCEVKRGIIRARNGKKVRQIAYEWVEENIKQPIKTKIGYVLFNGNTIQDSLAHGYGPDKLDAIPSIKDILEKGKYLGCEKDYYGATVINHYFAGKISFEGKEEKIVFCRVREAEGDQAGKRFYVHEIFTEDEISKGLPSQTGTAINDSKKTGGKPLYINILQNYSAVNEEKDYLNQAAQEHFGIPYLFPYQRLAISNILDCASGPVENNPAQIVILPTGAGKSLCFMLPALLTQGITLIIFPLLSLMADQKRRLDSAGIPSLILRGGLSKEERHQAFERIQKGDVKIVIANPEILLAPGVLEKVKQGNIFHVVIDEAHTVSQWGDTFRNAYLELGKIVKELKPRVTTAFTATASREILDRFAEIIFGGIQPNIIRADPDRPNIRYDALPFLSKDAALLKAVQKAEKPLIVFCSSREGTEITARRLKNHLKNQEVYFYHAGLTREEKKKIEDKFFVSTGGVLVATCAYGMGVDKSNIRTVIHAELPTSAEAYLQESGRGGRDRKQAYAVALVPFIPEPDANPDSPDARRKKELYHIFTTPACRRAALLHILEHESQLCTGCDVCDKKLKVPEGLREILELVHRNNRRMTEQKVSSILKGNLSPDNIQKRLYRFKSWGLLSHWSEKEIQEAIRMITRGNIIKITYDKKLCINKEKWVALQDIM
ncbi:MAG: RecQ family ATP-dependent DNA helicase [Spirochaetia bacterium]|nr:RecQ family ATP-dependent DNA helicase [Spirochaetia bacterium]